MQAVIFNRLCDDLSFDPGVPGPTIEMPDPWDLEDEHPLTLGELQQLLEAKVVTPEQVSSV